MSISTFKTSISPPTFAMGKPKKAIKRKVTLLEKIERGLLEVKLIQEGKLPKRSVWDLIKELEQIRKP